MRYKGISADQATKIDDALNRSQENLKGESGLVGLIGSFRDREHDDSEPNDIDIVFMPSQGKEYGERDALQEYFSFFNEFSERLQKDHGLTPAPYAEFAFQPEVTYIVDENNEGPVIPVHTLYFPDVKSTENIMPPDVRDRLDKQLEVMSGSLEDSVQEAQGDPWEHTLAAEIQRANVPLANGIYPDDMLNHKYGKVLEYAKEHYGIDVDTSPDTIEEGKREYMKVVENLPT